MAVCSVALVLVHFITNDKTPVQLVDLREVGAFLRKKRLANHKDLISSVTNPVESVPTILSLVNGNAKMPPSLEFILPVCNDTGRNNDKDTARFAGIGVNLFLVPLRDRKALQ